MKIRLLATGFVLGLGAALATTQALSQDQGGGGAPATMPAPSPQDMEKMMQAWLKSTRPGEQHEALNGSVGAWDTTTKMWMAGPDSEPVVTHGSAERKWVLDGRFVMEELKSEFPLAAMTGGQAKNLPWSGLGLFGYDNNRNMYVGCWADTMGTQLLTMKGSVTPDGKTFSYYGEMDEPMLGVYGRTVKYVLRSVDADTQLFEIIDLHAGDDYKVVEVTYKRKK